MDHVGLGRHRRLIAAIGALALVGTLGATACSGSSDGSKEVNQAAGPTTALPDNKATGTPVKIGLVSTEGGAAVSLVEMRQGAEAAVQYVNNNGGGMAGHPIDLVVCKQQEEPTSATNCANQFVEQKVAAVLSPGTSQGPAIVPIVAGAGIPYVTLNGVSAVELTSPDSSALSAGLPGTLTAAATAAKDQGMKTFTMFASDGGGTAGIIQAMGEPIFQGFGVDLTVVPLALGIPDVTPVVTSGLASKPDGMSIIADAAMCTSVLKAVQTTAPTIKKVLNTVCLDKNVLDIVGVQSVKGNIGIAATDVTSDKPGSVLYRSVLAQYAPNLAMTGPASSGYQAVMATVQAGSGITGDVNAASIKQALKTAVNVEMPAGGGITFSCDGTAFPQMPSICSRQMLIGEISDQGIPQNLKVTG
ncbi:conserved hypothetical protein (plasmid) [Rhodococcus jostii RHA1]|uniref:Leucine-binding protein domain-containing protein n=1 Tax=Rhodococcus jostii (strain RHA1) TaxID=101510 RepID=Q0RXF3_RHOJR|nr:ABC transporter substrate-binding protein [Rhodococcus jostii]ABH00033.1 conserved hypothetical protein [Rhodococcus jostii RHA1]